MPLGLACNNEQKIKITAAPKTSAGNPAAIDGALQGEVQSGDATVEQVAGEPNSLYILSGPNAGQSVIRVFGDADLGEGVRTIEDVVTLEVSGAQAESFGLTAGAPEPK